MLKHFTFFLILFLSANQYFAQAKCNTALLHQLSQRQNAGMSLDLLVQCRHGKGGTLRSVPSLKIKYDVGDIVSVSANAAAVQMMVNNPDVLYIEYINPHVQKMNDSMVVINRIAAVKSGMAPLAQAYDGAGIVIGLVDSGIDYHHPDFQDASGHTRIKHIWDMTFANASNTPMPYNYGQEWTAADIDAGNCAHTGTAEFGHGTHVAGIATGDGSAIGHFEGVAPKADIIMVALDFYRNGPTIADAVQYIATKAQALGKPFVINTSVGDYYGSHDATDLQSQMIDGVISNVPGRVLVGAAGNGGGVPFHLGYTVTPSDTNFTWISNTTASLDYWMYGDTNDIKNVKYSVGVNSPNYADLGRLSFRAYNNALGTTKYDTIYHNSNRIGVIESSASINAAGVYELYIGIKADSTGYNWRMENTGTGKFDAWNFDFVTSPLPSVAQYPRIAKYKISDTLETLVSSYQCSDEIITVANYINRNQFTDYNGTVQHTGETTGQLSPSSSIGPTRRGNIKPDVAASGATSISCMVLALAPNLIANAPNVVAQGGYHVVDGGTSSACPVVAGWAALYLQAHPTATNRQIKTAIINCTYNDIYTGTALPNIRWGYGKLDGFRAFTCDISTAGVNELTEDASGILVYPNPSKHTLYVKCKDAQKRQFKLVDILGNEVLTETSSADVTPLNIDKLSAGTYILQISAHNKIMNKKVMIE